jgi:ATP-dependent Clp protease ATP-binding subunit ClpA
LVVPFEPLKDIEYAEAVRRRLDRVVVRRLEEDRGIHVAIDETAVRCLASQAKSSGLGGERIDEVIESLVLGPLWQLLTPGLVEVAITADRSGLRWTTKPELPSRGPLE